MPAAAAATGLAVVMGDLPEKKTIRLDSVQPTHCCLMTLIELINFVKLSCSDGH